MDMAVGERGAAARRKLAEMTPKSRELHEKANDLLPVEVVPTFEMPAPICIHSAEGARVTDVDGNEYIDLTMGAGPHVLGHRPRVVEDAMHEQLGRTWHLVLKNDRQLELAELIKEAFPAAERTVFCNSGTEATMYGMRVARAHTGKEKVAVFDGCYHGAHDYALIKADPESPRSAPDAKILGSGVPSSVRDDTMLVLPYDDPAAFDLIRKHKDELAMVMVQPVQNTVPRDDVGPFLKELREVCRECGVLYLLDEVVTGFRLGWGGGTEFFDVDADLITLGKALGGGMPIGALSGRADIMAPLGKPWGDPDGVFLGGTFSGNPLTMAAGVAALTHMRDNKETVYPYLNEQGDRLAAKVNKYCEERQMGAELNNAGSIMYMHFKRGIKTSRDLTDENHDAEREFYVHLMTKGVIVPGIHLFFISTEHTPEDIDTIADAFCESLQDVREDGII
ncbi:MAG: aminotransferase class III-fold pyridoxal phosphate-dependent enzyme [Rhodospirillaceae bacterium]|nr:aminotransferase class III-fold pyridoxal phosphate-dependent enzyme [Rhodospirillaceae bacterium]MBT7614712.1 aminotransferase class III-fold pyridoxal phosphate-dependent enzyme [Rhodospirillaceae bacterium]